MIKHFFAEALRVKVYARPIDLVKGPGKEIIQLRVSNNLKPESDL
jgi:hypothetical protein